MSSDARADDDPFVVHRGLLFTVAYELLGSAADAEDVLQESWLRWATVDHAEVRDARAYLVRIVTRQALNHLRSVARRREDYVGEWLPEPLLTSPDVAEDVELADSLSIAMLTVLETLGPTERAVFVLREVFDVPYDEIADAVGKTPAAVRQIAHRAKSHVSARRPRVRVVRSEHEEVVERLITALNTGDLQALMDILAPDVVSVADSGGKVRGAARRPIIGGDQTCAIPRRRTDQSRGCARRIGDLGQRRARHPHGARRAAGRGGERRRRARPRDPRVLDREPRQAEPARRPHGAQPLIPPLLAYSWSSRTGPGSMYHSTNERARASSSNVITQRLAYTRSSSG